MTKPAADAMRLFARFFSPGYFRDGMVSLDEVADNLGAPRTKPITNGPDVPMLHAAGRQREVLVYCLLDTLTTTRVYQLLTGQATDIQ